MKFTANQTFLDGTERFEEGVEYDHPKGAVFVAAGWADTDSTSPTVRREQDIYRTPVDLAPHDSTHEAKD